VDLWRYLREAYEDNIFNFSCGAIEAALFYAVSYLLHEFDGLRRPFFVFGAMVISSILVDLVKHIEDKKHQWKIGNLAPRQLLRLLAIIAAFLGGCEYVNPLAVSSFLLLLVVVYTVLTSYAHWIAKPRSGSEGTQDGIRRL